MEYSYPVTVEFEDVDSYKIAHHPRLISYLERARVHFINSLGIDITNGPVAPVVYDIKIRFRKPARLLDRLMVSLKPGKFDGFRLVLEYRIKKNDELLVKATSIIAFCDLNANRLVEAPDAYQSALDRFYGGV